MNPIIKFLIVIIVVTCSFRESSSRLVKRDISENNSTISLFKRSTSCAGSCGICVPTCCDGACLLRCVGTSYCTVTCPSGQYVISNGCEYCPVDTYKLTYDQSTSCTSCPSGSSTSGATGGTSISSCLPNENFMYNGDGTFVCQPGYSYRNGICQACPVGSFKALPGNTDCTSSCPAYSTTNATFTAATGPNQGCACYEGYYGLTSSSDTSCLPCPANTYKATAGNGASSNVCLACPVGTTTHSATGQTSIKACQPVSNLWVPAVENSQQTPYVCVAGYTYNISTNDCSACPLGTFKPLQGNQNCSQCPAYSVQKTGFTAGAATSAVQACECSGPQTLTTAVPICQPCPANTFLNSGTCQSCPTGTSAPEGSTSCTANPGWIYVSGSYTCNAGYYWSTTEQDCIPCGYGTYKTSTGNTTCSSAVAAYILPSTYLGSTTFSQATTCAAGTYYPGSGTTCNACSSSSYRAATDGNVCSACPGTSQSSFLPDTSAGMCNQIGSQSLTGSTCPPGQYSDTANTCNACPTAAYNPNTVANLASCYTCPSGSTSLSWGTGGSSAINTCSCTFGFYAAISNNQITSCNACPANTFQAYSQFATSSSACLACGSASTASAGSRSCTPVANAQRIGYNSFGCLPGYGFNSGSNSCTACPAGTFQPYTGLYTCTSCPANSSSSGLTGQSSAASACTCNSGYYGLYSSVTSCISCPAGSYKNSAGNGNQALCTSCGTFETSASNYSVCVSRAGYTTSGVCNVGYGYNSSQSACVQCTSGSFKSTTQNATCTTCSGQPNAQVVGATNAEEACMCSIGSYYNYSSGFCSSCPESYYKGYIANDACNLCPPYSTTLGSTGNSNSSACVCAGGYYLSSSNTSCNPCGENYYKTSSGNSRALCLTCSGLSTTNGIENANSTSFCQCPAGYYGDLIGGCFQCAPDTYKAWGNSYSCTQCPWGTTTNSISGSTTISSCAVKPHFVSNGAGGYVCDSGYYPSNSQCMPCPSDYYKSSSGNVSCLGCSSGTTTRGHTGLTGCLNPSTTYNYDPKTGASSNQASSSGGAIAGAVVGCLAFTGVTAVTAYYLIRKRNKLSNYRMNKEHSDMIAGNSNQLGNEGTISYATKTHSSAGSSSPYHGGSSIGPTQGSGATGLANGNSQLGKNGSNHSIPSSSNATGNNKNWNFAANGFQPILASSGNAGNWKTGPNGSTANPSATWNNSNLEATIFSVTAMSMMLMTRTQVISEGPIVAFPAFLTVEADSGYRKLKKLGEGGFAVLYKGELLDTTVCQSLDMENKNTAIVAIKVFKSGKHEEEISDIVAEYENEASIMYALQQSPNISRLYALASKPELALIMKLYEESVSRAIHSTSSTLMSKLLAAAGGSYMRVITVLAYDLTNAVKFMHASGVAHLDLKPGNMLIETIQPHDGPESTGFPFRLVVCDFGLAKLVSETNVVRGRRKNLAHGLSIHYAAPEAFRIVRMMENGCVVNPQSLFKMDIFSLSSSVYEFAYKLVPFGKLSFNEVEAALGKGQRPFRHDPPYMPTRGHDLSIWKDMCTIIDLGWPQNPMNRAELEVIWELLNVTVKSAGLTNGTVKGAVSQAPRKFIKNSNEAPIASTSGPRPNSPEDMNYANQQKVPSKPPLVDDNKDNRYSLGNNIVVPRINQVQENDRPFRKSVLDEIKKLFKGHGEPVKAGESPAKQPNIPSTGPAVQQSRPPEPQIVQLPNPNDGLFGTTLRRKVLD